MVKTRLDPVGAVCTLAPSMGRIVGFASFPSPRRARVTAAFVAVGLSLALTGCAKLQARDLVREGNALYNEGRYREAIAKYDEAEKLEPDGVTLFWNRACAAESLVLKIKEPDKVQERRALADMALRDFKTWYDRLEEKTPEDEKQVADHRLAILKADERCDDLLTHWLEKHRAAPKEEGLYSVIARTYSECGNSDKEDEWYRKRTEDFPESVSAWYSLGVRTFAPLYPEPESGLPYNAALSGDERISRADSVVKLLDKATAIDPKFRDAYVYRAMAYTQRSLAHVVVEGAELPEEKLEAIYAREDLVLAWQQQKAVCDLDGLTECKAEGQDPTQPCCPPPPISVEERAADQTLKAELLAAIKAEQDAAAAALDKGKRKPGGKKAGG
jgi:tetratricopeptide (TPR) repeat protein